MQRWEYRVIMGILTSITLTLVIISVFALYPYDVLEIPSTANLVSTVIKKGEPLQYIGYMEKKMAIPSRQECYFQDGIKYALPSRWTNREPGYYKEVVLIEIPKNLPTDTTYTYCCDITYQPNPFQSKSYHWCTIPFTYIN